MDLDRRDPLAGFRDRFAVADEQQCYLDGNSLGRLPKATLARLARVAGEEWGTGLIASWRHWIDLPTQVGDRLGAALLGAGPGQVLVTDSTTVNLYRAAAAALDARPDRPVILAESGEFPTDRYVLEGLAAEYGRRLVLTDGDPLGGLDEEVAVLCRSLVDYRTARVADLSTVTAAAHAAGALVVWDLSHAAGALPVELDRSGADLAVGCTYKYLCAGPGAPAWVYVRRSLQPGLHPPVWGWMGRRDPFAMEAGFERAAGMSGWLTGTPNVLGLAAVDEGVAILAEAGVVALRAKSEALTALVVELIDSWLEPLGFTLVTPRAPALRGGHVSVAHPEAWRLCRALIERWDVVPDFRAPDVIRLGLSPLTTRFVEAWDGVDRLRMAFLDGSYQDYDPVPSRVT